MIREAQIARKTAETDIALKLNIDGRGESKIDTGCGFLDHMLTLFAHHGRFDIDLICKGDTNVDYHHSAEDIGICLGQAFKQALGDKRGIERYGSIILPMDEALVMTAIDFSGRDYLAYKLELSSDKVGDFDTELVEEFWLGFVRNALCTLHINQISGKNTHHIIEAAFKSCARSIRMAVKIDKEYINEIPSSKGLI